MSGADWLLLNTLSLHCSRWQLSFSHCSCSLHATDADRHRDSWVVGSEQWTALPALLSQCSHFGLSVLTLYSANEETYSLFFCCVFSRGCAGEVGSGTADNRCTTLSSTSFNPSCVLSCPWFTWSLGADQEWGWGWGWVWRCVMMATRRDSLMSRVDRCKWEWARTRIYCTWTCYLRPVSLSAAEPARVSLLCLIAASAWQCQPSEKCQWS